MKEQNKTPEKELNATEIAYLSDAEFQTLVIRMLRELTEYGNKIKEEMKVTLSEIKKNPQGTNCEGKETEIQINNFEYKEEINIQPEQKEETRILKSDDSIRRLCKHANILLIEMPEGEEDKQEIENSFKKIMKENFSNLVREIDIQIQEAQRV